MLLNAASLVSSLGAVTCFGAAGPASTTWLFAGAVLAVWLSICLVVCAGKMRRRREAGAVGLLALATGLAFVALYNPATNWLHGDDYYRALMAVEWAHGPSVHPDHPGCGWCRGEPVWLLEHDGPFVYPGDMSWLPLQFYVYGAFVPLVRGNLHLGFTIISQVLGFVTVVILYLLARELFNPRAAILSAGLLVLTSWHVVVNLSCLAEPLYDALAVTTLYWLVRWWRQERDWQLVVLAAVMALLAMTRYEAWILAGLACAAVGGRLLHLRRWRVVAWLCLAVPWLLPALWCLRSLQLHGHALNYYNVNRFWFQDAMGQWPVWRRLRAYPEALWDMSHLVCVLFLAAVAAGRWLFDRRGWLICAIGAAHLGVLVVLFGLGSAPLFVERVVLLHFALMLPFVGGLLWRAARGLPAVAVVAVASLVMVYGFEHLERAGRVFSSGQHCDHPQVRGPYAELGAYLRSRRGDLGGQVVVADDDHDHIISVISSLPRRVRTIAAAEQVPALRPGDVEIFCMPTCDLGRGWCGAAVEQAFVERNPPGHYRRVTVGAWQVYELVNEQGGPGPRQCPVSGLATDPARPETDH